MSDVNPRTRNFISPCCGALESDHTVPEGTVTSAERFAGASQELTGRSRASTRCGSQRIRVGGDALKRAFKLTEIVPASEKVLTEAQAETGSCDRTIESHKVSVPDECDLAGFTL
jgi:hypothetical protein